VNQVSSSSHVSFVLKKIIETWPSGVVKKTADLNPDPQLREHGLFWPTNHSAMGLFTHLGANFKLSKAPAQPEMPGPCLGEHTEYVCTKILGMSDEEFVELLKAGVLE
jgi:crotonobetainyl-CoA:carnitine CoA-transferase CaiB-like acyl-CoA transferase